MKTVIVTVIYPQAMQYCSDFVSSVNQQSDRNFDLLIVNDSVECPEAILEHLQVGWFLFDATGTPAQLRKFVIHHALEEKYDIIIFADADDVMGKNRVEVVKQYLINNKIIFNELKLFHDCINKAAPFLSKRFRDGDIVTLQDLDNSNCMGLSNTSLKTEVIRDILNLIPDNIKVFDWLFFNRALAAGHEAIFTSKTTTYYRQHHNNMAAPFALTNDSIIKAVELKFDHYYALRALGSWYEKQAIAFGQLIEILREDSFIVQYCEAVRKNSPQYPLWWEPIKLPKELGLC